ncbi:MAG: hypothetical protein HYX68_27865 [Planctomycetes bacterium]|nr:hypothetical protein [Planctomycetota bacterium]
MEKRFLSPLDVIRVLNREKISFVLVGAYGLSGYRTQARATDDVDVVVAARQVAKAVRALNKAFPWLEPYDAEVVVRLCDKETKEVAIDVMKPLQPPYHVIFKHAKKVTLKKASYRVPTLEMALACKFAPMISLMRVDERKLQDAADFIDIVKKNPNIDLDLLNDLGERVYNGRGAEILELIRKIRAGEKLEL